MKKIFKSVLNPILKYFQDIKHIEALKQEEYSRGCIDTAVKFSEQIKKQNEHLNKVISENINKIEEFEKQSLNHETYLREEYSKRISELETRYTESCNSCKKVTDEERKRINRLQMALADKLNDVNEILRKLYSRATMIAEEHSSIMQSTARAIASKNELAQLQKEMIEFTQDTQKYLGAELSDDVKNASLINFEIEKEANQMNQDIQNEIQQQANTQEEVEKK
jgi:hypothetical protein